MSVHAPSPPDHDPPPKAVLFCPECDHESPPTGDWNVREADREAVSDRSSADGASSERAGDAVFECPDCGAEIATRGRSELAQFA